MKKDPYDHLHLLLDSVKARSESAFAELYRVTSPHLFAIIARLVQDRGEAEDILQNVYVKIWNRSHQFDPLKGRPIAWLRVITRNAALDTHRTDPKALVRASSGSEDDDPYFDIPSDCPDAFDVLARKRTTIKVQNCLHVLSNDQRESVTLAYYQGMTHAEIATRLRRPLGTIKSQIRRALVMMRHEFNETHEVFDC